MFSVVFGFVSFSLLNNSKKTCVIYNPYYLALLLWNRCKLISSFISASEIIQGPYPPKNRHITGFEIPIINIRQSDDRLEFKMRISYYQDRDFLVNKGSQGFV